MKHIIAALIGIGVVMKTFSGYAGEPPRMEPTEWTKVEVSGADQTNVTRVLFIGDSILGGYYWDVRSRLGDTVKCASFETSKSIANPDFMAELLITLKCFPFSVIHINNGLHGMSYSESEYATALESVVATLRKVQPAARIIWAYTTPVRSGEGFSQLNEDHARRAQERNEIAARLMKKYDYAVNDLYSVVIDHPEYYSDGTHFNEAGRKEQADQVVQIVRALLQQLTDKSDT